MSASTTPPPLSPRRVGEAPALLLRALLLVALVAGVSGPLAAAPAAAQSASVAKPTLLAPEPNSLQTANPVLRWSAVTDAVRYRVDVATTADFSSIAYGVETIATAATPPTDLPLGILHWRVSAVDARGAAGPQAVSSFVKRAADAPALVQPADGVELRFPTSPPLFEWEPLAGVSGYEVEIDDDVNFIDAATQKTELTSFTLTEPQTVGRWFWRVRGTSGGLNSQWSKTRSYTVSGPVAPVLTAPENTTVEPVEDVVLRWEPVPGAARYRLQVSPNRTFSHNITLDVEVKGTQFSPVNSSDGDSLGNGNYFWRVQALDARDAAGASPWSANDSTGNPRQFRRAWLAVPTDVAPVGAASVSTPTLSWKPVDHASHYEVEVSQDEHFTTASSCFTHQTSVTPYGLVTEARERSTEPPFPGGDGDCTLAIKAGVVNHWRVRAVDAPAAPEVLGEFSTPGSFVLTPRVPTTGPLTPVTGYAATGEGGDACPDQICEVRDTPRLSWDHVPGASSYRVYLAHDPAFTNRIRVYSTQHATITPREALRDSQAGQAYYWFVRPCASTCGALEGELQRAHRFRKVSKPVVLQSPEDGAVVAATGLRFSWEDYRTTNGGAWTQSARGYRLQVSTVKDFSGTHVDDVVVDQTSYAPWDKTYPEGPLFWRVQAIDGSENELPFSDTWSLEKSSGSPEVLAPTAETVDRLPYFRWKPMPSAASYEVEVAKDGDTAFSPANLVAAGKAATMQTAWAPSQGFGGQGRFAWRVRAVDVDGRKGVWSPARVFWLQSAAPVLVAPVSGTSVSSGTPVVFDWQPVAGAASYRFQVSSSRNFTTVPQQQDTVMTEWAPLAALPSGTHFWRVQVLDAKGELLASSEGSQLVVAAPAPGTAPSLPADPACTGPGTDTDGDGRPDRCDDVVDLHNGDQLYPFVRTLMKTGISTGCADRTYCPTASVTRAQMAIFLLRAAEGPEYVPPPATGVFADVPPNGFAANYVEELRRRGITSGCTADKYCPHSGVTRSQMAVFLLRASESGGYLPPAPRGTFTDVPASMQFADWIEELSARKITSGCTATTYCPGGTVTRRQMAAFLVRAFDIPLA